jgi:hypothetical protein
MAVAYVAYSLRRPTPDAFPPTHPRPYDVGDSLVGPVRYTIDASSPDEWRYFDFSRGSVVSRDDELGWDLAFRRFHIIANGGVGFAGRGGIVALGAVAFDSVRAAPAAGYVQTTAGRDTANAALARWYDYGWTSHLLTPKPHVWVVRTADGRYARLRILSYYCPGARPGCITFSYVYQGSGDRALAP